MAETELGANMSHKPLRVSLIVQEGNQAGVEIKIRGPKFLIGRSAKCHLRPRSDLVSKLHCIIEISETGVVLNDLGSTNGTLLNGKRVEGTAKLTNGDLLRVGTLLFTIKVKGRTALDPASNSGSDSDVMQWLLEDPADPDNGMIDPAAGNTMIGRSTPEGLIKYRVDAEKDRPTPKSDPAGDPHLSDIIDVSDINLDDISLDVKVVEPTRRKK